MVKQNLGKLDRVFRFALAVWWLGPWTPGDLGLPFVGLVVLVVGWIALVESFVGFCLLHTLLKINNKNQ